MVVSINAGMGERQSSRRLKTVCEIHHQVIFVLMAVVFEDVSVFANHPNIAGFIYLQMTQIWGLLDGFVFVQQRIVGKLFAIVPVYSFMGQEPHVSFGVFFNGYDSTATKPLIGVQIAIKLCRSRYCSLENEDK